MPSQITRLLIFLIVVGAIFLFVRRLFVPESFGEIGHYRAAAVDEIISQEIKYAGHQACQDCHDDISEKKSKSYHRSVNCETCHGPGEEHIQSGGEVLPEKPRDRGYCTLCHEYNPARPTGYAQIDPVVHNPAKRCIICHNPHAPDPSRTPDECSACHTGIAKTKALSPHAILECSQCHNTPSEHRIQPRAITAEKPTNRADCLKCHDTNAKSDDFIPRVASGSHGEAYLCWQCHYPHYPEIQG